MKNKFELLVATIVVLLLSSCHPSNEWTAEELKGALNYQIVPIKLEPQINLISLKGLAIDESQFVHAQLGSITIVKNSTGELEVNNNDLKYPIENLHLQLKNGNVDIPLFKSEKINFTFEYQGTEEDTSVFLAGAVNGWNNKSDQLLFQNNKWLKSFTLSPGRYPYRLWINGKETLDQSNPNQMPNGLGGINNFFDVGDVNAENPMVLTKSFSKDSIAVSIYPSVTHLLVYLNNTLIQSQEGEITSFTFGIPSAAKSLQKSNIRIFASNNSKKSNDLLIPLKNGEVIIESSDLSRQDWQSSVMYFMMVDRFFDADSANNRPTLSPEIMPLANNLGGDLQGITKKIKDGYFEEIGVNTIWVSPISRNAEGAWGLWDKGVRSTFSAYHGYWPTALTKVDDRFGTEQAFQELISTAHDHDMNVVLDYVAHHVHQDHPLYKEHPEWSTNLYLEDGRMNTELWDEQRLTTWFDTFLPTWDFSKKEVVEALTDTAMYWVMETGLDGFRHDATKHIPEDFWKTLTYKIRNSSDRKIFQIGETYGSPELISSYIGNDQLDAQFDFNLYDAIVDAFAKPNSSFENLNRVMQESLNTYGFHNTMGNITGNQDRARFISYADGSIALSEDAKLAGWTRNIQHQSDTGFYRLAALQAFLMTTPGIPCIYYGDEIGLPGGNDPDNRRMMKFEGLSENEIALKKLSSQLVRQRRNSMALMYGDVIPLMATNDAFVFIRKYFDQEVIVVFTKSNQESLQIELPDYLISKDFNSLFSGDSIRIENNIMHVSLTSDNYHRMGFEIFTNTNKGR